MMDQEGEIEIKNLLKDFENISDIDIKNQKSSQSLNSFSTSKTIDLISTYFKEYFKNKKQVYLWIVLIFIIISVVVILFNSFFGKKNTLPVQSLMNQVMNRNFESSLQKN